MSFLLSASEDDIISGRGYQQYIAYLNSIKNRLPQTVYEFAVADWHYNYTDPRCPHDAWAQEIKIKEIAEGETHAIRRKQIEILLLGAYHDRLQKVTYENVRSYSMNSEPTPHGHGDWLIDEISLSESGLVVHEIEFRLGAHLQIECDNILFQEQLTSTPYEAVWV